MDHWLSQVEGADVILLGDCLKHLQMMPDNSVDAVVCDPPYFLTNGNGSGFMGKEWDSLSVRNAFAESVLRSLKPVYVLGEASSAQENANTSTKRKKPANIINALYVEVRSIDQTRSLSLSTFSVEESVLTKAEALALSKELCPSLTSVFESQPDNVAYVVPISFTKSSQINIAHDLVSKLHTKSVCEELETLHTLMDAAKTSDPTEAEIGKSLDLRSIAETNLSARNVENIVAEKRYSVTTLSLIDSQKTIRWIISLPFVRSAMRKFMENPSNIQILSERFHYNWLIEVFRVMKPGAHLLAFAGTRTYGRLAVAIEDAGFEIRDQIQWLYGSGFPKSHNLKGEHEGFGTALKPANEPICMARKPLEKGLTVAENVLKHGTGAINVDGCRIGYADDRDKKLGQSARPSKTSNANSYALHRGGLEGFDRSDRSQIQGRWPANVLLDEAAAEMLDGQVSKTMKMHGAGNKKTRKAGEGKESASMFGVEGGAPTVHYDHGEDSSKASRFFYVAKASKAERNAGLEGLEGLECLRFNEKSPANINQNHHPTVKPVKLMQHLITLVTPPNGTVLDPFMGSGSTGVACKRLGFNFIGIELNEEYVEIAERRIASA